ncbi:glycosyltransferase family 2 protein [Algoriphagus aquimarinus]|uniref:Glycosyl transferase family 2 n=1 Tax=Algoriphagus aquimarinus TaxID=237018 RepID=A0A1I1AUF4_9BACT|nr:glycosyltransferase family 2 protein [Algoriphagus aquimarinus]SFB41725.1 Glycosyl transferase family 2 [Algoriphagus aquimarinus]
MNPLISIIIPTKNRQLYCRKSISHILSLVSKEIHLVICDNSDSDDLREFCYSQNDHRVEYFHTYDRMNMAENFQKALKYIKGDYFMFLGDDDTVNPFIIEFLTVFKRVGADAIVSTFPMYYVYPNSSQKTSGNLNFYIPSGNVKKVNLSFEISKLLDFGLQEYNYTALPRPYHGIIRTKVLDKLVAENVDLFGGISPDIYSCIVLSNFIENVYHLDYPLSIAGACPQSGSSKGTNNSHCGRLEDAFHFENGGITWSDRLPRFYSVETVWAYAGIQAFEKLGLESSLRKFNVYVMTARAIVLNRSIFKLILSEFYLFKGHSYFSIIELFYNSFTAAIKVFKFKFVRKLKLHILNEISITEGVDSFDNAIDIFDKRVKSLDILAKLENDIS